MADILITGGVVIPVDPGRRIIPDGAVAIAGDRILAVGPAAEIAAAHEAETVIDATGMAVIPGLIDGHAHAGHGLIKTMGGGRSDLWYRACEGVLAVGTRSIVAIGPTRPPFPRTYAEWRGDTRRDDPVSYEQQVETCRALIGRWHGAESGRIAIALLTPTLRPEHREDPHYGEAAAQAREVCDLAREKGLVFTQDGHTTGSVAIAHELGLLGPSTLLSHATGLTEAEIRLCAETDTRIAHNPSAVASILARCPVTELLEAGVTVCLGSDATAPDRSADMFRHMQQCMHYHRTFHRDPSWLPPGKVIEMCTIDAARALGRAAEIGSLEPGKKADVTLVDLRRPHMVPANMPEFRLAYFANGNDVHTVIVDGRIVLRDRKALLVDEDAILDRAERETALLVERLGLADLLATPPTFWGHVRATDQVREARA